MLERGSDAANCPICGLTLAPDFRTRRLYVAKCPSCKHRIAQHLDLPAVDRDYHEQYEQTGFVDALGTTRRRQARRILALAGAQLSGPLSVLDFGAGRGWFLEEARRTGIATLAGLDTSSLAVQMLRANGFEALLLPTSADAPLPRTTFRPRVLTALDVIEHFENHEVRSRFRRVIAHFEPELVVVKVPLAGLLYRGARVLSYLGSPSALEQLYQVGTSPPHFNYFSQRSLSLLLRGCGLEPCHVELDPDFEGAELSRRARAFSRLGPIAPSVGRVLFRVAQRLRLEDSMIVLARVR